MEIISFVVEGALEHKDSMGTGSIVRPGEIQCMSAGKGIEHSEFNHSGVDHLHFLQIWIIPDEKGLPPGYQQCSIPQVKNELILIGTKEKNASFINIHQDIKLYTITLETGHSMHYDLEKKRSAWLQVIKGRLQLNGQLLTEGDGAAVTNEPIEVYSQTEVTCLLFDLNDCKS